MEKNMHEESVKDTRPSLAQAHAAQKVRDVSPMQSQLSRNIGHLERLSEVVGLLEDRLQPVLASHDSKEDGSISDNGAYPGMSDHNSILSRQGETIVMVISRVNNLLNRLEV
jgi:hypothetical protein